MPKDARGYGSNPHEQNHPSGPDQSHHGPKQPHSYGQRVVGAPSHLRKSFDISPRAGRLKLKTDKV
jgi:hypothetical protein